jgi:hypothetical protein
MATFPVQWDQLMAQFVQPLAAWVTEACVEDVKESSFFVTAAEHSFLHLYTLVKKMVADGMAQQLYWHYIATVTNFIAAYAERGVLLENLHSSFIRFERFVMQMDSVFCLVNRKRGQIANPTCSDSKHCTPPPLRSAALLQFRVAMDCVYGSTSAASSALTACTAVSAECLSLMTHAPANSATAVSAEALQRTQLQLHWCVPPLSTLCLRQMRDSLAETLHTEVSSLNRERRSSMHQQLDVVRGALARKLTLTDVREAWLNWPEQHTEPVWSAFETTDCCDSDADTADCSDSSSSSSIRSSESCSSSSSSSISISNSSSSSSSSSSSASCISSSIYYSGSCSSDCTDSTYSTGDCRPVKRNRAIA